MYTIRIIIFIHLFAIDLAKVSVNNLVINRMKSRIKYTQVLFNWFCSTTNNYLNGNNKNSIVKNCTGFRVFIVTIPLFRGRPERTSSAAYI